jgi:hypothetical protein
VQQVQKLKWITFVSVQCLAEKAFDTATLDAKVKVDALRAEIGEGVTAWRHNATARTMNFISNILSSG